MSNTTENVIIVDGVPITQEFVQLLKKYFGEGLDEHTMLKDFLMEIQTTVMMVCKKDDMGYIHDNLEHIANCVKHYYDFIVELEKLNIFNYEPEQKH